MVSTNAAPAKSFAERDADFKKRANERQEAELDAAKSDPLVKAILDMFPGSSVKVTKRDEQVPDDAYEDIFMEEREDE